MNYEIVLDDKGVEHVIIDRGNDEFTSMLKTTWDELKKAELEKAKELG